MNLPTTALAACLLCACASAPPSDIPPSSTLTLLPHQAAPLGRRASVRVDRVDDSRCPAGVQCVWAGVLRYHLTLEGGAAPESFTLDERAPSYASRQIPGLTVALAGPARTAKAVTLAVTRTTTQGDAR